MIAALTGLDSAAAVAWERVALLLGPLALAGALVLSMRPTPREASAAVLAFLWQVPSLLALNLVAQGAGWWSFPDAPGPSVAGLPVDVWIGWAFWWGPVAALLEKRLGITTLLVTAAVLDVAGMPALGTVRLSEGWLVGEPILVTFGLLPGLLLARWTRLDTRPMGRTLIHAVAWGLYMLFALPVVVLAVEGRDPAALARWPQGLSGWVGAALLAMALMTGAVAAFEFAAVGHGTPVPLDPPKRVVMSGPYAYVANPMQLTSAVVMALLALHFGSIGLLLVTGAFLLFDSVYAAHYNRIHIARAMPHEWSRYKAAVSDWRVRWRPYRPGMPLVIANTGEARRGRIAGILMVDDGVRVRRRRAAGITRLVFVCPETGIRESGVAALSRLLERRNLPWALFAWGLRLPVVLPVLQGATRALIVVRRLGGRLPLAPHRPSKQRG